ncbi:hypothetical protein UO65_2931 [Actinokineospora spheciospongiae]|uniref:Uncharacterized protein n=1 Tax=Actinokineospora spheciospongiae TaxID=909613 RepID=W7J6R6_9PSEU|nr:hypothetical protein [Actinokineospora spheciospongiae]EWC61744.1 hypothetical protein UO65_2931 [Actinokineospora spheciospongiae]PWW62087.1 hypothetical protein DFQ13_106340 [Actinokineospora spheciospongiae]
MTDNDKPDNSGTPQGSTPERANPEVNDGSARPGQQAGPPPVPGRKRGSVNFQDASTTAPREPTLGEQRARRDALRREREAELAEYEEAERKRKLRKRVLIGAGVTVGVVAVVAVIYAAATPDEVTATCTSNGVVVDDDYCDPAYASAHNGYSSGGFIYIGGSSYRYNYGGTGRVGQPVSGGSYTAPSGNTSVKTASGKSVQRGGLGVGGSGKSSGS